MTKEEERSEARRQCILAIADQLKKWADLSPDARETFMIAQITDALGWAPDMYVDLGFVSPDKVSCR